MTQQKKNDNVNAANWSSAPVVSIAPDNFILLLPTWLTPAGDMRPDRRANRCISLPTLSAIWPQDHVCRSPNTPEYHLHVSQSPLKKCAQSIFSAVWQWVYKITGSRLFFLFHNRTFLGRSNTAPRGKRRPSVVAKHRICNRYRTTPSN